MNTPTSMEIRGIPPSERSHIDSYLRLGAVGLGALAVFYILALPEGSERFVFGGMLIFVAGIAAVSSEYFAHEQRKDEASIIIHGSEIRFTNDYLDRWRGRRSVVAAEAVDHVDVISDPELGQPRYMLVITRDGEVIGSGRRDSGDLLAAVPVLREMGLKVNRI